MTHHTMDRKLRLAALAVFFLALGGRFLYCNAFGTDGAITPDSSEYVSIARHLTAGEGYRLGIKFHYYRPFPIDHPAWGERPPLYPCLLSFLVRLTPSEVLLHFLNALFPALTAALFVLLAGRLTGNAVLSLLGGLLYTFNPWVFENSLGLHSEEALMLLTALGLLLVPPASSPARRWLPVGVVSGLAVLTRGNGLLLLLAAGAYLLWRRPSRLAPKLACLLAPYLLLWSIIPFNTGRTQHEMFYDIHSSHYVLPAYDLALWHGYGYQYPTAGEYLRGQLPEIVAAWAKNTAKYLYDLCNPWLLGVFVFFVPAAAWRGPGARQTGLLLLLALLNLAAAISFWSVYAPRFLLPVVGLLLPVALRGGQRLFASRPGWFSVLLVAILILYGGRILSGSAAHVARGANGPHAGRIDPIAWAHDFQDGPPRDTANDRIAATDPWLVNRTLQLPAALIPEFTDESLLQRWLEEHRFTHLVLDLRYTPYGQQFLDRWIPRLDAQLLHSTDRIRVYRLNSTAVRPAPTPSAP